MNTEELFIDSNNLPKALNKEETYDLFVKFKNGDKIAYEKLIKHNIRLVLYTVTTKFKDSNYDKKELVSIGINGLIKATN